MVKSDLLEIAEQLKKMNKQQEIANYLKLYEVTKDVEVLSYVAGLMGYNPKLEEQNKVSSMFK